MPTHITDETIVVQSKLLPHGEIDGELMALDAAAGDVIGLDAIGTAIWGQAEKPTTVGAVVEWAVQNYDVAHGTARSDIHSLITQLLEIGLLVRSP